MIFAYVVDYWHLPFVRLTGNVLTVWQTLCRYTSLHRESET